MARISGKVRKDDNKQKPIDPVWRGLGCVFFLLLTVGLYFLIDFSIDQINLANQADRFLSGPIANGIPRSHFNIIDYEIPSNGQNLGTDVVSIRRITIGWEWVTLTFTLFFSLIIYALVVIVYGMIFPPPTDEALEIARRRTSGGGRSR